MVLLAVVDARYQFIMCDFGVNGRISDGGVLQNTTFYEKLYGVSRARRIVENAFGILASRFRIYKTQINREPKRTDAVVMASCALHNFLMSLSSNSYTSA
nr:unnamed protein product [Callosobruchus analis]